MGQSSIVQTGLPVGRSLITEHVQHAGIAHVHDCLARHRVDPLPLIRLIQVAEEDSGRRGQHVAGPYAQKGAQVFELTLIFTRLAALVPNAVGEVGEEDGFEADQAPTLDPCEVVVLVARVYVYEGKSYEDYVDHEHKDGHR